MPQRIREAAITSTGARLAVAGAAALAQVLISRKLGPQSYGLYGVTLGTLSIAATLTNSGVAWSLPKIVASFDAKGDDEGISAAHRAAVRFQLAVLLVTTVLLGALAPLLIGELFRGKWVPYLGLVAGVWFYAFGMVFNSLLLGLREIRWVLLTRLAQAVALVVLAGALLYGLHMRLAGAVGAYTLSLLAATIVAAIGVRMAAAHRLVPTTRRLPGVGSFSVVATANSVYETAISMGIVPVVALLAASDQRSLVGYVALLAGLGLGAQNLLQSIYYTAYPYVSRWQATAQGSVIVRFLVYGAALAVVFYGGASVVGALWGEQLIAAVFGERFRPASSYIGVAAFAIGLVAVQQLVTLVLNAIGRQNQALAVNMLGGVAYLSTLLGLGSGTDLDPVDVVLVSTAAASGVALLLNGLLVLRDGLVTAIPASAEPSPSQGIAGGADFEAQH